METAKIIQEFMHHCNSVSQINQAHQMRKRLNPHHSPDDQKYEADKVEQMLRHHFEIAKVIYCQHRIEMKVCLNFSGNYTKETAADIKAAFDAMDKCLEQDAEAALLGIQDE
jgi:hypothetical protein